MMNNHNEQETRYGGDTADEAVIIEPYLGPAIAAISRNEDNDGEQLRKEELVGSSADGIRFQQPITAIDRWVGRGLGYAVFISVIFMPFYIHTTPVVNPIVLIPAYIPVPLILPAYAISIWGVFAWVQARRPRFVLITSILTL